MLVPFEEVDYLAQARELVTEQFKDKPIFDKYLQLIMSELYDIQTTIKDLIQKRSIDEATGNQLDIIGRIVGQPRELISLGVYKYFAFLGYPSGQTYGDVFDPSKGGVFYTDGQPTAGNYLLEDSVYRLFIKSKILKNRTASTPEELITFLRFLFGDDTTIYLKEGVAECTIFFGRPLSDLEKNLLSFTSFELGYPSKLIPMTIGVGSGYASFKDNKFFAFQGIPNAKGFKDANDLDGWGENWGTNYGEGGDSSPDQGGFFASYLQI